MALKKLKTPKTAEELISGINWKLLKKQKKSLLETIDYMGRKNMVSSGKHYKELVDDLTGILNLVDTIQDYAVDTLGIDENEVFDLHKD